MQPEMVFYDGHCALCQGTVKFFVKADRAGNAFRFAPLWGETFQARVPPTRRDGLPDSIVLLTEDGELLTRSTALVHMLKRLGGFWGGLGTLLGVLPRGLRDFGYDLVARVRHKLFPQPEDVCPVMPPHLRARFDK